MAIRIRKCGDVTVALCAARSMPKEGDVYLDDTQHHALAIKFEADFAYELGEPARSCIEQSLTEVEESNNPNRAEWDRTFGNCNRVL